MTVPAAIDGAVPTHKKCGRCGVVKAAGDFYPKRDRLTGLSALTSHCKQCISTARAYNPEYRKRKADRMKEVRLQREYGLTLEQYNEMFSTQRGCCAICGRHQSEFARGLVVDHDHATGAVRALLCMKCNCGVGYFDDDPAVLMAAIQYLNSHGDSAHAAEVPSKGG